MTIEELQNLREQRGLAIAHKERQVTQNASRNEPAK